jgi:two-component system NtrC family sensor kinase
MGRPMIVARKFTLALVAGILCVNAGAAVYQIHRERELFEADVARDSRVLGRALGHAVERTWLAHGEREALDVVEHATGRESHVDIRWVWVAAADEDAHAPAIPVRELKALRAHEPVVKKVETDKGEVVYTYVPVEIGDLGLGAIEISDPLGDEEQYLFRSIVNGVVTMLVLVALCAAVSWALGVRLIARPVRLVVEQARAIGRGELGGRLKLPLDDELGELAGEMDQMCDRLLEARHRIEEETRSRIAAVDQLRHADRLRTVGTLASGIAHELGTPINVIEGHAGLLREDVDASPGVKESAEVIARQCKRMAGIIRQLLDFARRGGRGTTCSDPLEVVRQTLAMVAPLARQQGVDVTIEGVSGSQVAITFGALQQVLANLFVNALHAMAAGGSLRVCVEAAEVQGQRGHRVAIRVTDSGVGMSAETLERIFEPFFTTKDVGEGTGLGLAIAYAIIDDHGGSIDVESEPGRGSSFTVSLPVEERNES